MRVLELTLCPESIINPESNSTDEAKANVEILCREGNFETSSLAEFGCCTDIVVFVANDERLLNTFVWLSLFRLLTGIRKRYINNID